MRNPRIRLATRGQDSGPFSGPFLVLVRSMPESCAWRDMEEAGAQCAPPLSVSSQTGLSQANVSAAPSHNCSAESYIYQDSIALPWKVVNLDLCIMQQAGSSTFSSQIPDLNHLPLSQPQTLHKISTKSIYCIPPK